jgi:ABC-type spermidine/putrescine transport system permease subunit I
MNMSIWNTISVLALLTLAAFVLNLPFGYMRVKTKKFSVMWFLYIHLPIPFIFVLRTMAGFGMKFIPIMVAGAVLGQLIGGRLNASAKVS